jgi:hypothetical protein
MIEARRDGASSGVPGGCENRRFDDSQNPVESKIGSTGMRFLIAHVRKWTAVIDYGYGGKNGCW